MNNTFLWNDLQLLFDGLLLTINRKNRFHFTTGRRLGFGSRFLVFIGLSRIPMHTVYQASIQPWSHSGAVGRFINFHSRAHSPTNSLTHSLTHSPTYTLTITLYLSYIYLYLTYFLCTLSPIHLMQFPHIFLTHITTIIFILFIFKNLLFTILIVLYFVNNTYFNNTHLRKNVKIGFSWINIYTHTLNHSLTYSLTR